MIELKNITKTYKLKKQGKTQTITAVSDVNLQIAKGEIFGIVGKSGAGKSTLVRCVNLLERPTSGSVIVNNIDLTELSKQQLNQQRKKISMIFQHFNLLESRTAAENIALPLELANLNKSEIKTRVDELLKLVDLSDRANNYPGQLSGGQKQRVAIARALATSPEVLLCDEATSALDPESTQSVLKLLKSINQHLGLTILLITHEMNVVKTICDRMAVFDKGKCIEQGNVLDVFTEPKSEITKRLTQSALHLELPQGIADKIQKKPAENLTPIIRLAFIGKDANEPVMSTLQDKYSVSANILLADLETIQNKTIGFMLCQLSGSERKLQKALDYLDALSIKVEVLGYA